MTPIGERRFIVADYNHLYLIDETARTVTDIVRPRGLAAWDPTGVHFSTFYNMLFVANYAGQDVLAFRLLEGADISLELAERVDDHINNVEGIDVSPNGRYMAVANEGDITLFERKDGGWTHRWSRKLLAAHGVAIIGDQVFASGASLATFDLATGEPLGEASRIGERPIEFASCVNDAGDGNLIVSDTIGGYVAEVDRKFHLIARVGENGPGLGRLDMPYCAYRFAGRTFIISTMQARIVVHGPAGTQSWLTEPAWLYEKLPASGMQRIRDDSPEGNSSWAALSLLSLRVRMSYGMLKRVDGLGDLSLPLRRGLFGYPWAYYWMTAAQGGDLIILVANSSPIALVYDRVGNALGEAALGELGCWAIADRVLCPSRAYSPADLRGRALMLKPDDILAVMFDAWGNPVLAGQDILGGDLASDAAQKYVTAANAACTRDELDKAHAEYETSVKTSIVPLVEYWLASVIAERRKFSQGCQVPNGLERQIGRIERDLARTPIRSPAAPETGAIARGAGLSKDETSSARP
jgi:hypothetical protein